MKSFAPALVAALGLTAVGLGLIACNNGTSAPSYPSATPIPSPTSTTVVVPATATTVPIPAVGAFSGTANVPAPSSGNSVSFATTVAASPPSGVPALTTAAGGGFFNVISVGTYDSITPSSPVTYPAGAQLVYTLASGTSTSGTWYLATYDTGTPQNGWYYGTIGPGVASGQNLTFTVTLGFVFAARQYVFAVYRSS